MRKIPRTPKKRRFLVDRTKGRACLGLVHTGDKIDFDSIATRHHKIDRVEVDYVASVYAALYYNVVVSVCRL